MKNFYRVEHIDTKQGLWYDIAGNFTGLIHNEFNFCKNADLQMPFDPAFTGWLSATNDLENLWRWFTEADMLRLEDYGYTVAMYEATKYKYYDDHWLICQHSSVMKQRFSMSEILQD